AELGGPGGAVGRGPHRARRPRAAARRRPGGRAGGEGPAGQCAGLGGPAGAGADGAHRGRRRGRRGGFAGAGPHLLAAVGDAARAELTRAPGGGRERPGRTAPAPSPRRQSAAVFELAERIASATACPKAVIPLSLGCSGAASEVGSTPSMLRSPIGALTSCPSLTGARS